MNTPVVWFVVTAFVVGLVVGFNLGNLAALFLTKRLMRGFLPEFPASLPLKVSVSDPPRPAGDPAGLLGARPAPSANWLDPDNAPPALGDPVPHRFELANGPGFPMCKYCGGGAKHPIHTSAVDYLSTENLGVNG